MVRMTSQKKIIMDYLAGVKTHPTAQQVYDDVKKQLPQISLATVYRILKNFRDKGQVLEIQEGQTAHYDADTSNHVHFVCDRCAKIYDIHHADCIPEIKCTKVGKIRRYNLYVYGECKQCSNRKTSLS